MAVALEDLEMAAAPSIAPISTDNATLERMSDRLQILVRIFLTRILASGLTSGERMTTIIDFVICNTDIVGPEPICPLIRRRFLVPEGFMLQQLFGFAMLLVACLAVFLALRIGLSIGRDDQNRRES